MKTFVELNFKNILKLFNIKPVLFIVSEQGCKKPLTVENIYSFGNFIKKDDFKNCYLMLGFRKRK